MDSFAPHASLHKHIWTRTKYIFKIHHRPLCYYIHVRTIFERYLWVGGEGVWWWKGRWKGNRMGRGSVGITTGKKQTHSYPSSYHPIPSVYHRSVTACVLVAYTVRVLGELCSAFDYSPRTGREPLGP